MIGEHRHMILQALCRGAVRKWVGEGCPRRGPTSSQVRGRVSRKHWVRFSQGRTFTLGPVKKTLKGKVKDAWTSSSR